jgi:hypothetical protein
MCHGLCWKKLSHCRTSAALLRHLPESSDIINGPKWAILVELAAMMGHSLMIRKECMSGKGCRWLRPVSDIIGKQSSLWDSGTTLQADNLDSRRLKLYCELCPESPAEQNPALFLVVHWRQYQPLQSLSKPSWRDRRVTLQITPSRQTRLGWISHDICSIQDDGINVQLCRSQPCKQGGSNLTPTLYVHLAPVSQ